MSNIKQKLIHKQNFINNIREFFQARGLTEVFTPHLATTTGTDVHINPWQATDYQQTRWFLHTSPEFAMKKLLAQGSGDIFQICRVYRDEPIGTWHNREFDLLEWYRVNWDLDALISEVIELISKLTNKANYTYLSIRSAYKNYANWDPWDSNAVQVAQQLWPNTLATNDLATWFDYVMVNHIEPNLPKSGITILYNYPTFHAALAKIAVINGIAVAKRFECYVNGIEIANGFFELNNSQEQQQRFNQELKIRKAMDLPCWPIDQEFLDCLDTLPNCSGVALGLDRLFNVLQKSIDYQ